MSDPVSSKLSIGFRINMIFLFLLVCGFIIFCLRGAIIYDRSSMLSTGILCSALFIFYVIFLIANTRKFTAAPEGLIINYLLLKKKIIIQYEDIKHINSFIVNADGNGPSAGSVMLKIELISGEEITINKGDITNYDELKEAIRRQRFSLDYKKIPLKE